MAEPYEHDEIWITGGRNALAIEQGNLRRVLEDRLEGVLAQNGRTLRRLETIGTGRVAADSSVIYPVMFIAADRNDSKGSNDKEPPAGP